MLEIESHEVEWVKDPFGILPGKQYEFRLMLDVPEEDELYSEHGIYLRVIYRVSEEREGLVKYDFYERGTDRYLDFDMEEDETAAVEAYCREHWREAEEE